MNIYDSVTFRLLDVAYCDGRLSVFIDRIYMRITFFISLAILCNSNVSSFSLDIFLNIDKTVEPSSYDTMYYHAKHVSL